MQTAGTFEDAEVLTDPSRIVITRERLAQIVSDSGGDVQLAAGTALIETKCDHLDRRISELWQMIYRTIEAMDGN